VESKEQGCARLPQERLPRCPAFIIVMDNCGTELALCDRSRTRLSGRIVRYLLQNTPKPFPYLLVTDRGAAPGHSLQAPILIRRASVKFVV
jgi:hypothetical protein